MLGIDQKVLSERSGVKFEQQLVEKLFDVLNDYSFEVNEFYSNVVGRELIYNTIDQIRDVLLDAGFDSSTMFDEAFDELDQMIEQNEWL